MQGLVLVIKELVIYIHGIKHKGYVRYIYDSLKAKYGRRIVIKNLVLATLKATYKKE